MNHFHYHPIGRLYLSWLHWYQLSPSFTVHSPLHQGINNNRLKRARQEQSRHARNRFKHTLQNLHIYFWASNTTLESSAHAWSIKDRAVIRTNVLGRCNLKRDLNEVMFQERKKKKKRSSVAYSKVSKLYRYTSIYSSFMVCALLYYYYYYHFRRRHMVK